VAAAAARLPNEASCSRAPAGLYIATDVKCRYHHLRDTGEALWRSAPPSPTFCAADVTSVVGSGPPAHTTGYPVTP
jgi:hypothetical protein